jgi:AAA15 family ATPase/GTPase
MKITSIALSNFKSFSQMGKVDFLDINFIFGFNNSGKSNLLKFIETVFSRKVNAESTTYQNNEGETKTRTTLERVNFWEGIIENHDNIFRIGSDKGVEFEISVQLSLAEISSLTIYAQLLTNSYALADKPIDIVIKGEINPLGQYSGKQELVEVLINTHQVYDRNAGNSFDYDELLSVMNDSVLFIDFDRFFKNEIINDKIIELKPRDFRNWLFNLSLDGERNNEFTVLLNKIKAFTISSTDKNIESNEKNNPLNNQFTYRFQRQKNSLEIILKNKAGLEIPLSSFGTGVHQLIYLLFKINESNVKVLLLEEIELNLSAMYQNKIVEYIDKMIKEPKKSLSQAFITSHSPIHCYRNQDGSYVSNINDKGETQITRLKLTEEEVKHLKEVNAWLRKTVFGIEETRG